MSAIFLQALESQGQNINSFANFADWCENKNTLDKKIIHTIDQLLVEAKTSNCKLANQRLLNEKTSLYLNKKEISSLLPLRNFPNIVRLSLIDNQISDLTPLKSLPNLECLYLDTKFSH